MLDSVEGRLDDVVQTADGRRVGRLDPVFKGGLPLREAQIIQERIDRLRVRYVPAAGFSESTKVELRRRLELRLGEMEVDFEPVAAIPRTANGKLRAVVSHLRVGEAELDRRQS